MSHNDLKDIFKQVKKDENMYMHHVAFLDFLYLPFMFSPKTLSNSLLFGEVGR
jgi:hypothetical protein